MQHRRFLTFVSAITLLWLHTVPCVQAERMPPGQPVAALTPQIAPGQYVWHPEVSPAGPVVIVINLPEQVLYVYRNGVRIGRSSISSGKAGHRTPTGVFTVLQKNVVHHSSTYHEASMPYMERLTWGGVAIHAGGLPGYPESHGCIHVPLDFAKQLYTVTGNGTSVIITDTKSAPGSTAAPGLLFAAKPGGTLPTGGAVWKPEKAATGPVSIVVSSADGAVYVYRSGVEIGHAPVGGLRDVKGLYVYSALANIDAEGRHDWFSTAVLGSKAPDIKALVKQVSVDPGFLTSVRSLVTPGTTLILTDAPVNVSTRSGPGFGILTTAAVR
jgi:hypothetical protein